MTIIKELMIHTHYERKETKINVLFDVSENISQEFFINFKILFEFL